MARRRLMRPATRARAQDALDFLREPGRYGRMTAREAAHRAGSSLVSMRRMAGRGALRRGELAAKLSRPGTYVWRLPVATPDGWEMVSTTDPEVASLLGRHTSAIESGKSLDQFENRIVRDSKTKEQFILVGKRDIARWDREGIPREIPTKKFSRRRRTK